MDAGPGCPAFADQKMGCVLGPFANDRKMVGLGTAGQEPLVAMRIDALDCVDDPIDVAQANDQSPGSIDQDAKGLDPFGDEIGMIGRRWLGISKDPLRLVSGFCRQLFARRVGSAAGTSCRRPDARAVGNPVARLGIAATQYRCDERDKPAASPGFVVVPLAWLGTVHPNRETASAPVAPFPVCLG